MSYRRPRTESHRFPTQLSLPLGYFELVPADLLRSRGRSKRPHSPPSPRRLEALQAMLARLDIVPASSTQTNGVKYFRQGQRFQLTPLVSVLINEVNGKRWPDVAALPPQQSGPFAEFGEGGPHVERGSRYGLQEHPLG